MSLREARLTDHFRGGPLLFSCDANISRSKEGVTLTLTHNRQGVTPVFVPKCQRHTYVRSANICMSLEQ